jgi:molybdopterin-binding protein
MKHGARNDLPAEVTAIKRGAVMCQVDVKLIGTDYKMSSVMTLESLESMGLEVGDKVKVLAKAVNVLLTKG